MASNQEDSYVGEISQGAISHSTRGDAAKPIKEQFSPWHKPRKHWIRKYQWALESGRLIRALGLANGRALRYMTLPGPDMLDVRSLHVLCEEMKTRLRFIGYIVPSQNDMLELELSESEIRDLAYIDGESSRVIRDDFQSLADANSVASSAVLNEESFDVINIDLCKCVGEFEPDDKQRAYFESIAQLFTLQVKKRQANQPWLFFITTRADFGRVHGESRDRFFRLLLAACADSTELERSMRDALNMSSSDIQDCIDGKPGKGYVFELAFAVALGEWLAHLLMNFTPQVSMELLSSSRSYGIKSPRNCDMLSLAFKCETIFDDTSDESGLSGRSSKSKGIERSKEFVSVSSMVKSLSEMLNLDEVFGTTGGYRTITEAAAEFMGTARFSVEGYREWAWSLPEVP